MKKYIASFTLFVMVFSFLAVQPAQASGEKFVIDGYGRSGTTTMYAFAYVQSGNNMTSEDFITFSSGSVTNENDLRTLIINGVLAFEQSNGYPGAVASDVLLLKPSLATVATTGLFSDIVSKPTTLAGYGITDAAPLTTLSFNNIPSHSIVTTAAAANGWQISSTRNASVFYSVNVNTTATIGGASDGYILLEIAATNSTTASDWKEVSRTRNGQTVTLALALNSIQNIGSELMNIVPAGYYVRLRSVNVSGTPTYTYVSGQEVQL